MTREETVKILMMIQGTFPNFKPMDKTVIVDIWQNVLDEYTYQDISLALKTYILTDTSGFAPSPGQLVEKIHSVSQMEELTETEAWALVAKAIQNGFYGAEQEYNKLPEPVQKAVGNPSNLRQWAQTDIESIENVIQSNFMRTYRTVLKREREFRKMPKEMRNLIESTSKTMIGTKEEDMPFK